MPRCPKCGKSLTQRENETREEFRDRWENDKCLGKNDGRFGKE